MRRRLILAIAAVTATALVLLAVPLGLALRHTYRDDALVQLQRDTFAATRQIDLAGAARDRVELPPTRDVLAVYDQSGRLIAGSGPNHAEAFVLAVLAGGHAASEQAHHQLMVAVPLVVNERVTGAVRAARGDANVAARARRTWLAIVAAIASVMLLALLAASVMGRRLARPLERLAITAGRLGEGDFDARSAPSGVVEVDGVAATLNATAARLHELMARERAFSADVSHQLRTPLAALRLELESVELDDNVAARVSAAIAQVDRLQSTIDTLLAAARDTQAEGRRCDLAEQMRRAESRWRGRLAAEARPLRTDAEVSDAIAACGASVCDEILDILVDNARVHGAGAITLTLCAVEEGSLAIDVADEGPGFVHGGRHAFERRAGERDGHGIGLALARSLAQAEGGRIDIRRPGAKPVVTLLLPRSAALGDLHPRE